MKLGDSTQDLMKHYKSCQLGDSTQDLTNHLLKVRESNRINF